MTIQLMCFNLKVQLGLIGLAVNADQVAFHLFCNAARCMKQQGLISIPRDKLRQGTNIQRYKV